MQNTHIFVDGILYSRDCNNIDTVSDISFDKRRQKNAKITIKICLKTTIIQLQNALAIFLNSHAVRINQASDIAKLWREYLSLLELIACIGCAVVVQ